MKILLLVASALTAAVITACSPPGMAAGPEAEAKKIAKDYWLSVITKCGDNYYFRDISRSCGGCTPSNTLVQLQDPAVTTTIEPVSEATRLNGIEMKAYTKVSARAFRTYATQTGWDKWRTPTGIGKMTPSTGMFLKDRKWIFGFPEHQPLEPGWQAVDCSKIPE
ncbi:MAG TPA: hypothetical protein VF656_18915 [Pyrinomonadaceae bacterium]|jgi:hypothetical protein